MTIGVDIDNVLNSLCESVLEVYNSDSGDNVQFNEILNYGIEQYVKPAWRTKFWEYFGDERVWDRIVWRVDWVVKLIEAGEHDIYFITATHPEYAGNKFNQLLKALTSVSTKSDKEIKDYLKSHFVLLENKHLFKADIIIDDYIENLHLEKEDVYNILVSKPWNIKWANRYNATYLERQRIIICDDTDDIPEIIETIRSNKKSRELKTKRKELWTKKWGNIT